MGYKLRPQKRAIKYIESSSNESDSHDSDPDYSRAPTMRTKKRKCRSRSRRPIRRNKRAKRKVMWNSRRDKSAKSDLPDKESNDADTSGSSMKRGSFSGEERSSPRGLNSSTRDSSKPTGESCVKRTIMSWLINCKVVEENEEVYYMNGTKESANKTGRITRGGIICCCCNKEMSVWEFEKHAGSKLKKPYEHIFLLRKGTTCLLDCQIAAWDESNEQRCRGIEPFVPKETATDKSDDACSICGDGGALICCEKCPSTFHPHCMNIENVPQDGWLCPYCVCKYCGLGGDECSQNQMITCSLCDKKFHWACFREFEKDAPNKALDLNCMSLYCEQSCRKIHEALEGFVGTNNELDEMLSWRLLRPMEVWPSADRHQHVENNSKVALAWSLMDEAFETVTDRHTDINMIQSVVYSRGSNLRRIDFSHFYTCILEKEDEVICAASIRVHGARFAEMPFIATAENHRGRGFCGILVTLINSNLGNLNIESLLIPCVEEDINIWSSKYGFKELSREMRNKITSYNMLMFPFAVRMFKDLTTQIAEAEAEANGGEQANNPNAQEPQNQEAVRRPGIDLNVDPPKEEEEEEN